MERKFGKMSWKIFESRENYFKKSFVILLLIFFFQTFCKESEKESIQWHREKEKALKIAQSENKKIILFFQKEKCNECTELKKLFGLNKELKKSQNKFIFLQIQENENDFLQFLNDDRYSELQNHNFLFVIINASEEILLKTEKFAILIESLGKI